jgi:hypothetical protein
MSEGGNGIDGVIELPEGIYDVGVSFEQEIDKIEDPEKLKKACPEIVSGILSSKFGVTLGHNAPEKQLALRVLEKTGFDVVSEDVLDMWRGNAGDTPEKVHGNIKKDVSKLFVLGNERVGKLMNRFGIRHFGRYPSEMLKRQVERESKILPDIVILNTVSDNNGSLYQDENLYRKLFLEANEQKLSTEIYEFDGRFGLGKLLVKLIKRYEDELAQTIRQNIYDETNLGNFWETGDVNDIPEGILDKIEADLVDEGKLHKISGMVWGGHGHETGVNVKRWGRVRDVDRDELMVMDPKILKRIKRLFVDKPTIVMNACLTGAYDGWSEKLSEVLEAEVFSSDKEIHIRELDVYKDKKGKIKLHAGFMDKDDKPRTIVWLLGKVKRMVA